MEGEWSCYGGCHHWRERGHIRGSEVVSLMEGESCGCGQFKEGRMVVIEVAILMEGEWFCYKGGLFNGGQMVVLERRPV